MSFSVLLLVKNRYDHLLRALEGIALSSLQPAEIIIVHMNEAEMAIDTMLPIKQITLTSPYPLPLAAARNAAAKQATTEQLIFLDVDCIPAPDCFNRLVGDLEVNDLIMTDPLYLKHPVKDIDYTLLKADSSTNPARKNVVLGKSTDYELFWSLGFAISKENFWRIGGFDESFVGYGGEDTDFAFRAQQFGLQLYFSQAQIYHQNHPSYDPPLNWLSDIVTNAHYFKKTWQHWPMQGWLQKFSDEGYVSWSADDLTILKLPTQSEIDAALKSDAL